MTQQETGIFWTPRGGNNEDSIWASCHVFNSVTSEEKTTIVVDMGQNEFPQKFENGAFDKVVPALDDCFEVPDSDQPLDNKADAIFLTHGHSDHIAGVYEYLHMGVELPPIYATPYTLNALQKGLIDSGVPEEKWPEMKEINQGESVKIGNMTIDAFSASHSIPGCLSFKISNEEASIFHSGDTKADEVDFITGKANDLSDVTKNGAVDLMTFDATATNLKGHATYETEIFDTYKKLFEENKGKQIIALLPPAHAIRIANVINAANAVGTDVAINGGASMETNLFALESIGYDLKQENPNITIGGPTAQKQAGIVITTGIYQENNSPFIQHLNGENSDFVMQENAVIIAPFTLQDESFRFRLEEKLDLSKVRLITASDVPGIYGSGHAQKEDFLKIATTIQPSKVVPIHCSRKKAERFNALASQNGYATFDSYPCNGMTVRIHSQEGSEIVSKKEPHWFGLKHSRDKDGNEVVSFKKRGDNGFSSKKEFSTSLQQKQEKAREKIAQYKKKQKEQQTVATLVSRKRNANSI